MNQSVKDTVQVIFEIVMILASIGVLTALFKKVYSSIKNSITYFANLDNRVKELENKINKKRGKRKPKK